MDLRDQIRQLKDLQLSLFAYHHAMSILNIDGVTAAPRGSSLPRSRTMGVLSEAEYRLWTDRRTVDLLDSLWEERASLDPQSAREVHEMRETLRKTTCIPMEEYTAYAQLQSTASDVWHESKEKSDFASFLPFLEKLTEMNIRFSGYRSPGKDPYDAALDEYEKGANQRDLDAFFSLLRRELTPVVRAVGEKRPAEPLKGPFPLRGQRLLTRRVMDLMGLDSRYCAVAETEHPFTDSNTRWDVRITTHYYEEDPLSSLYSVIHEGGHALYELGTDDSLQFTCLGGGSSMGIHESQSRFYENIIGRSREFIAVLHPILAELFPEQMKDVDPEKLYRAANRAVPGPIRTEADELTYPMHIMVRYELEKALFNGSLACRDLPGEWNRLYREYLGVTPQNDREGVLQDSHWAGGAMGYFPSYALGSAYGAQMLACMEKTVDVRGTVARGDLSPVTAWLRERIHHYGRMMDPQDLLKSALDGAAFDPAFYVNYLKNKFSDARPGTLPLSSTPQERP